MKRPAEHHLARPWAAVASTLCLWALVACAPGAPAAPDPQGAASTASATSRATDPAALKAEYSAAVADAQSVEQSEVVDTLIPLRADNPQLKVSKSGKSVLMATWTSWDGYAKSVGDSMITTRDVWVTPVPQLQSFCSQYARQARDPDAVELRLEQYLGLPTDAGETEVASLWVPFDALFRPSADPQIDDTSANVEAGAQDPAYPGHSEWLRLQQALAYDPENPYPWTQLGYTYDWGNPDSEVGASEYVVRVGSKVKVASVDKTARYCS